MVQFAFAPISYLGVGHLLSVSRKALDWFQGTFAGNHRHQHLGFPVYIDDAPFKPCRGTADI